MNLRVALVTAHEALPLDEDLSPLVAALGEVGVCADTPVWDDPQVDWAAYDLAVLRSTWDYAERIGEFLEWVQRCEAVTRVINPLSVVRWNTDKHYLCDLDRAGVPVVPTRYVEPGADPGVELAAFSAGGAAAVTVGQTGRFAQFVVKPAVGAGSRDAARYRLGDAAALNHLRRLVVLERRSTMLQPYLSRVDEHGETAVVFIGGQYSHAVRKGPLLRLDAALVAGLFAAEEITPRAPEPSELEVATAALAAIPVERPHYARVDLVRDSQDQPVVLELELAEPSLFFNHAPGAAQRLARVIVSAAGRAA